MLTYDMSQRGDASLYEYLYACIRRDIESGAIAPGQHLPSKRKLAEHIGVSVITIEGAYDQLVAEGYVESVPRRGFFAVDLGGVPAASAAPVEGSGAANRAAAADEHAPASKAAFDLTGASSAEGLFPYLKWAQTLRQVLSEESEQSLAGEADAMGSLRLRRALVSHLREFRGINVLPQQIVVGAGAQTLYGMIVQMLGRDLRYAVEDPGYPRLTRIYDGNNVPLSHVPMDAKGMSMGDLRQCDPQVVHIMPSHQFPLGLVYPVSRRYELLAWASEKPGRWIIEDDFDCEFRMGGRPIPALRSVDSQGCVIYTNTFTKSLGPGFRIGYMVLPLELVEAFQEKLGFYSCTVGVLDQLTLARFIESGDYERHLSRLRNHYRKVSTSLVSALRSSGLGERAEIDGENAGLHFVLRVRPRAGDSRSEAQVAHDALQAGVHIQPLESFWLKGEAPGSDCWSFVVSLGGLHMEDVDQVVESLESVL